MLGFKIEKLPTAERYNIYFEKEVNKRDGTVAIEYGEKLYGVEDLVPIIAHRRTQDNLKKDVSLKEYFKEFYKQCELLNQISF